MEQSEPGERLDAASEAGSIHPGVTTSLPPPLPDYNARESSVVSSGDLPRWICANCFAENVAGELSCSTCAGPSIGLCGLLDPAGVQTSNGSGSAQSGTGAAGLRPRALNAAGGVRTALTVFFTLLLIQLAITIPVHLDYDWGIRARFAEDALYAAAVLAFAGWKWRIVLSQFRLRTRRASWIVPFALLVPAFTIWLAKSQRNVFPDLTMFDYGDEFLEAGYGWGTVLLMTAVYPAIIEEIAFRGIIQKSLALAMSPPAAIVTASLMFAVVHFSMLGFVFYLMPMALLSGWAAYRTGSLLPSMIIHLVHNGVIVWIEARQF